MLLPLFQISVFCFVCLRSVSCVQCFLCRWIVIVHSGLSFCFFLQFIIFIQCVLLLQVHTPARCTRYNILYDIKFVSDLRKIGGFFPGTPVSATNKTDSHDIAELLLKVTLSAITLITLLLQVALRY